MTHLSFNGALFFWIILAWAAGGCRVEQALPPPPGPTLPDNENNYQKKILPTGEPDLSWVFKTHDSTNKMTEWNKSYLWTADKDMILALGVPWAGWVGAKLDDAVPFSLTRWKIIIGKILQSMKPHRRMKCTGERGVSQEAKEKGFRQNVIQNKSFLFNYYLWLITSLFEKSGNLL